MHETVIAGRAASVEIRLARPTLAGTPRRLEPVTIGIPVPMGLSRDCAAWSLSGPGGTLLPLQVRPLDRWADGSTKWALLDFQATADERTGTLAVLAFDGPRDAGAPTGGIAVSAAAGGLMVDTGAALFRLAPSAGAVFSDVVSGGHHALDPLRSEFRVTDADGRGCAVTWEAPVVDEPGALRTAVRVPGTVRGAGFSLDVAARLNFFAGSAAVRFEIAVLNPRRAAHPGGIWELGDPGSVLLREVALHLARPAEAPADRVSWSVEPGAAWNESAGGVEVHQESSGGENWKSRTHVNRLGDIPLRFCGYRGTADGAAFGGRRATPIVLTSGGGVVLGATVRHFWENFPKGMSATANGLTVALFPGDAADLHELQGGERKTHECWLLFGGDGVTARPLEWRRSPLLAHAPPEWYSLSEAVPWLTPAAEDTDAEYLALVQGAIEGNDSFVAKRERADEYGWRDFGDLHADHEGVLAPDPAAFVSHYNNQYDAIEGCAVHFLRTGDPRWWSLMDELARHVVDIDVYHTDGDKAAYDHGLFWHTTHYVDAGRSSHRSYPRADKVWGGGPSAEHDYTTGLLHHHLLTGSDASRLAVLELAGWVLDMDDGRKSRFRWLDRGDTGLASATGSELYHGPGRAAGNSVLTLLNAHALTGERRFLDKAEQLIRRCVHPAADIAALDLLDAERKWFYTVFLQALGKYLHYKGALGQRDERFEYGRESLLHFARWMADNEYPYLDKPEILEYPNETWAAQDMRKSEVFDLAAHYAAGDERTRFRERSRFFHRYSTGELASRRSSALVRPRVLMLSYGWAHAWFERAAASPGAAPEARGRDWGRPERFEPQKVRAIRRAKVLAAALAVGGLAGIVGLLFALFR